MALMERFFPVQRHGYNFFDRMMQQMQSEFQQMDQDMERMRQQMFQLVPMEMDRGIDVRDIAIQPQSPFVEEAGQSKLKLEFNLQNFKPEEVVVKVVGANILQVEAKHESRTDTSHHSQTYFRQYQLPSGVDPGTVKPALTRDGVLTIEAPAPPLSPKERMIPIEYK